MPIAANPDGVLDIENATLRSREIATLSNFVAGNDEIRSSGAPVLEVYGDPANVGGLLPTLELVSNTASVTGTSFTRFTSNAGVFTLQSGTGGDADSKGDIAFSSVGGDTEHMRIQGSTGNVGIGTDNPGFPLDVQFTGDTGLRVKNSGSSHATFRLDAATGYSYLRFDQGGTTRFLVQSTPSGDLAFRPSGSSHVMDILNNGNVGINSSSPSQKLVVGGYAQFGLASIKTGGPGGSGSGAVYTGIEMNGGAGGGFVLFFVTVNSGSGANSGAWIFGLRKFYSSAGYQYPYPHMTVLWSNASQTNTPTLYTDSSSILKFTFGTNRNYKWTAIEM